MAARGLAGRPLKNGFRPVPAQSSPAGVGQRQARRSRADAGRIANRCPIRVHSSLTDGSDTICVKIGAAHYFLDIDYDVS
jgi:hypothetical protein